MRIARQETADHPRRCSAPAMHKTLHATDFTWRQQTGGGYRLQFRRVAENMCIAVWKHDQVAGFERQCVESREQRLASAFCDEMIVHQMLDLAQIRRAETVRLG